jgi:hypothetical protein
VTRRFLVICTALLALASFADAGRYQRSKDRQIRVWNEHPEKWDEAVWTGDRDENGYATGAGILTWYHIDRTKETGTLIPSSRGHELQVIRSFSGTMTQGRFEGAVIANDDSGKKFQATYADGSRVSPWTPASGSTEKSLAAATTQAAQKAEANPPAEGPQTIHRSAVVDAPTQDSHTLEVFRPPSSLRATYVATTPQTSPPPAKPDDSAVVDFKLETEGVLSRVREATANWRDIEGLDSVQPLPAPVSGAVRSLGDRAKSLRPKIGSDSAARAQIETADALQTVNETTRALAAKDAAGADSKLSQFLKNHPSPPGDNQKDLWRYLTAARSVCERSKKQSETHLQRAQLLVTADEINQAIDEYRQANRLFPSQATADKIQQLTSRSASITNP